MKKASRDDRVIRYDKGINKINPKVYFFVLLFSFSSMWGITGHEAIPEVLKPTSIAIDGNNLYVSEEFKIHRYQLKELKWIESFGNNGEGPGEFSAGVRFVKPQNNKLYAYDWNQVVTIFNQDGKYLSRKRLALTGGYGPRLIIGEGVFVLEVFREFKNTPNREWEVNIFDKEMKLKRTIKYEIEERQDYRNKTPLSNHIKVALWKDRIVLANDDNEGLFIRFLDLEGNKVGGEIHKKIPKIKVSEKFKEITVKNFLFRYQLKKLEPWKMKFPEYFPSHCEIVPEGDFLYVIGYSKDCQKRNIMVLDSKGKTCAQKEVFWPDDNLYYIRNGIYYYLLENDEEENYKLFSVNLI